MLTITYITMLRLILICSTVKFVGWYGMVVHPFSDFAMKGMTITHIAWALAL